MIVAFGANLPALLTLLSENLHPMAIMQSHSVSALFVVCIPCIPIIPRDKSSCSDIDPFPINVVAIGMLVSFANSYNSLEQLLSIAPPPANMIAFLDWFMTSIAFLICLTFPFFVGLYPGISVFMTNELMSISSSSTFRGRSITTGPGLPVDAI